MNTLPDTTTDALALPAFRIGQEVHVNAGPTWVAADIASITHTRIGVRFHRRVRLAGTVCPWQVRPAHGVWLCRAHALCAGDRLLTFAGTVIPVAATLPHRDPRLWIIDLAGGERAVLPARAVLRVRNVVPQITVNGVPL